MKLVDIHSKIRRNIHIASEAQRKTYKQKHAPRQYKINDIVYLYYPKPMVGVPPKFGTHWFGPWKVIQVINKLCYQVKPIGTWSAHNLPQTVVVDRMKPFISKTSVTPATAAPTITLPTAAASQPLPPPPPATAARQAATQPPPLQQPMTITATATPRKIVPPTPTTPAQQQDSDQDDFPMNLR
jgi:hypothetical protein